MTARRKKCVLLGVGLSFMFLFCLMPDVILGEIGIISIAVFGWVAFIRRVSPQIQVRWGAVGSAVVYVGLLLAGAHYFLRWLYREMRSGTAPPAWRWRWTTGGLLIILIMFTCGMAAIGVAHQTAWLVHSPEPLLKTHGEFRNKILCRHNVRQIGQAALLYANDHGGKFPDDIAALLGPDITASVFVCPSTNDEDATGATTQDVAADVSKPHHCSYIYLGKGLTQPVDSGRVIALEPLENHRRGINVVFADAHVEWLDKPEAEALLAKLGLSGPTTRSAGATAKPQAAP